MSDRQIHVHGIASWFMVGFAAIGFGQSIYWLSLLVHWIKH